MSVMQGRPGRFLTVRELADRLNVSEKTIYRKVYAGALPHLRVGKGIRFNWSEVRRTMACANGSKATESGSYPCGEARERLAGRR